MQAGVGLGPRWWALSWWQAQLAVLLCVAALAGCASTTVHRVRPGETLWQISARYGVSVEDIARANALRDPDCIAVGQELRIPEGRSRVVSLPALGPSGRQVPGVLPARVARRWRGQLRWPVDEGFVSSVFGPRGGTNHDGIDISGQPGAPVRAAYDGEVVFAGPLRGYGLTVVLEHDDGLATVYAHNERNLVRAGERVRRGQIIARLGQSGRVTGPNLHFEVRHENVALDPLLLLPARPLVQPKRVLGWGG